MVEPRLVIVRQTTLETDVKVLARIKINFLKPIGFHVRQLLLVHHVPKNCHGFNQGKDNFY